MNENGARLRTPAAILETAARVLADHGDASMNDIAAAAGVGRATVYRHYPTREALLDALEADAREQLATRIADAGLDLVPVPEALGRLLRAIFTVGDRFLVLRRERTPPPAQPPGETAWRGGAPILALFQRGIDDHTLRDDLSANHLSQLFGGLVQSALAAGLPRAMGVEQTAAIIASMFLDGARRRP
ncbi:MAG TPA: helix-turn-helix domain-containing protein [Trebonia sp.]